MERVKNEDVARDGSGSVPRFVTSSCTRFLSLLLSLSFSRITATRARLSLERPEYRRRRRRRFPFPRLLRLRNVDKSLKGGRCAWLRQAAAAGSGSTISRRSLLLAARATHATSLLSRAIREQRGLSAIGKKERVTRYALGIYAAISQRYVRKSEIALPRSYGGLSRWKVRGNESSRRSRSEFRKSETARAKLQQGGSSRSRLRATDGMLKSRNTHTRRAFAPATFASGFDFASAAAPCTPAPCDFIKLGRRTKKEFGAADWPPLSRSRVNG